MEYCVYDLKRLLIEVPKLEIGLAKIFFQDLLNGLSYIHENNIIHRDIKSENLLITSEGVLKIGDLGSAREMKARGGMTPNLVTLRYRYGRCSYESFSHFQSS